MIDALIIYSLSIYWLFHILSKSEIMRAARELFNRTMPSWMIYISQCAFCFTSWAGILVMIGMSLWYGGIVVPLYLLAGPVFNLVLDLLVRVLLKTIEPPIIITSSSSGGGNYTYTVLPKE